MGPNVPLVLLLCSMFLLCVHSSRGPTPAPTSAPSYPPTVQLSGIIRDQSSHYMLTCNGNTGSAGDANNGKGFDPTDFEIPLGSYTENEKGLVGAECNSGNNFKNCGTIGSDSTPTYVYSGTSPGNNVKSPATFQNWFHNTDQVRFMNLSITLNKNSDNTYGYSNDSFFPLDGLGWKDHCYDHNYNYCYEVHTLFGFSGHETFNFLGDDDVWVYINGQLVIDLGSLHQAMSASLDVGSIPGLSESEHYPFDFFYCERHTTASQIELTTSIMPFCSYYDWCGICQGNGQGCCTQELIDQYCDDHDPCTQDLCAVSVDPRDGPDGCQHIQYNCTAPDDCTTVTCAANGSCIFGKLDCGGDSCTNTTCQPVGGCLSKNVSCDDKNLCTNDFCDPSREKGCYHVNITCPGDACNIPSCDPHKGCVNATVRCNEHDACKSSVCDPIDGCPTANISCGPPDACLTYTCDPVGGCHTFNVSCDDGKGCTIDTCVHGTGPGSGCQHTLKDCSDTEDQCVVTGCDNSTVSGCTKVAKICPPIKCKVATCYSDQGCVYEDKVCNGGNLCTEAFCDDNTGECSYPPKTCTTSDACQNATCDLSSGNCVLNNITCTDGDPCTQDLCFSDVGCSFPPQNCAGNDGQCPNAPSCNDFNSCTNDFCNSSFLCEFNSVVCPEGNACQTPICDRIQGCGFLNKSCEDGNPCTNQFCNTTTGNCSWELIPFCNACGDIPCIGTDSCNPSVCVNNTCVVQPYTGCPATDFCTNYVCNGTDVSPVCEPVAVICETADACHPVSCVIGTGCVPGNKSCDDNNLCTNDYCTEGGICHNDPIVCEFADYCNPVSCNLATGQCDIVTPVDCTDGSLCSQDLCDNTTGICSNPPVDCGNDLCNPKTCNTSTGLCVAVPVQQCPDPTPCSESVFVCDNGVPTCNVTTRSCDDGNPCTTDRCNSTALPGQDPCYHIDKICTTDKCSINLGCSNETGECMSEPLNCNTTDYCNPGICQPLFGCVNVSRKCPNRDPGCFISTCEYDNDTFANGTCVESKVNNFGSSHASNGVLCPLVYDKGAKVAAITAGATAGIVIGGVAAAALLGFGGKKTYDFLNAKNAVMGGVSNNPMYAPSGGAGENPLFVSSS